MLLSVAILLALSSIPLSFSRAFPGAFTPVHRLFRQPPLYSPPGVTLITGVSPHHDFRSSPRTTTSATLGIERHSRYRIRSQSQPFHRSLQARHPSRQHCRRRQPNSSTRVTPASQTSLCWDIAESVGLSVVAFVTVSSDLPYPRRQRAPSLLATIQHPKLTLSTQLMPRRALSALPLPRALRSISTAVDSVRSLDDCGSRPSMRASGDWSFDDLISQGVLEFAATREQGVWALARLWGMHRLDVEEFM